MSKQVEDSVKKAKKNNKTALSTEEYMQERIKFWRRSCDEFRKENEKLREVMLMMTEAMTAVTKPALDMLKPYYVRPINPQDPAQR